MKTQPNLARLFSLHASSGKAANSNYQTPPPNLRPFVSPSRLEQKLLRRSSPNVSTWNSSYLRTLAKRPLRPIDAQKKR